MMEKSLATPVVSDKRVEPWLIGILILLGTTFRAWRFSDLGLVHFDEGVYAISGLWAITPSDEPQLYTKQILFSPPLFFALVGAGYWILGEGSDQAAILVNVVVGGATIALVWWVTRRWFGQVAGIAAAALLAFSDFHIAYSRMALTDITFGFFYLLALVWIAVALERKDFRWAILSGLAVGAAWNTKYHGWLPLIVALIALVAFIMTKGHEKLSWRQLFLCWIAMAAVAVACYLPWALYVQTQSGGYLSLMKYQRSYLSPNWLDNLGRQAEMQWYMDGWLSRFSPVVAYLLALAIRRDRSGLNWSVGCLTIVVLTGSGLALGGVGTAAVFSILAIPMLVRRGSYPCWLLVSSLGLLLLLTPFYRPYSRLLMPWILSVYIVCGAGIGWILAEATVKRAEMGARFNCRSIWVLVTVGTLFLGAVVLVVGIRPVPRTWIATNSIREAARTMADMLPEDSVVLVHGDPIVAFYLRLAGREAIPIDQPIDHPDVTTRFNSDREKVYLVTGIYSQREPRSRASLKHLINHLRPIGVFPIEPNDVRLLDDFTPAKALQYRLNSTNDYDLNLYRVGSLSEQGESVGLGMGPKTRHSSEPK